MKTVLRLARVRWEELGGGLEVSKLGAVIRKLLLCLCLHLYISNLKGILSKQHQQNEIHQVYSSKNTVVSVILRHLQINTG